MVCFFLKTLKTLGLFGAGDSPNYFFQGSPAAADTILQFNALKAVSQSNNHNPSVYAKISH